MKKPLASLMLILLLLSLTYAIPLVFTSQVVSTWELDRPSKPIEFHDDERIENASTNDEASIGVGVHITKYEEDSSTPPFEGRDGVSLRVVATANTRKGIEYWNNHWCRLLDGFPSGEYMFPTNITDDNSGRWFNLPFGVYFYGGPGRQNESACYNKVWVCSNGFLSFTSDSTNPYPKTIPNPEEPNTIIAAFWTDLDPFGGSIKYNIYTLQQPYWFLVVWDNVLNKQKGTRETFAVVISNEVKCLHNNIRGQNKITLLYKNVSGDSNAVIGIEDQEGYKGYAPLDPANYPTGEDEIWLYGDYDAPEIRGMTIKVQKSDSLAEIKVCPSDPFLKGFNMEWINQEEDSESIYATALQGAATLLWSRIAALGNPLGGILFGSALLSYNLIKSFARMNWPVQSLDYKHAGVGDNFAYINATAAHVQEYDWPVDTTLDDLINWIFTDSGTAEHSIKIFAEVEYYSYKYVEFKTISTSVTLKMTPDICNSFSNPKQVVVGEYRGCLDTIDTIDMYKISVGSNKQINLTMWPFWDANYDLYLYSPSQVEVAHSTNIYNSSESIIYSTTSSGDWYIKVKNTYWENHTQEGIYKLKIVVNSLTVKTRAIGGLEVTGVKIWIDSDPLRYSPVTVAIAGSHTIQVENEFTKGSFQYTFSHWNYGNSTDNPITVPVSGEMTITAYYTREYIGTCPTLFVWNGTDYTYEALLNIHADSDITIQHIIEQTLVKDGIFYKLSLRELDEFISHIDQVRLYAVDANGITHTCILTSAIHSQLGRVTAFLWLDDEIRIDLHPTETTDLKFFLPYTGNIAYFIFEINGHNKKDI